MWWFFAIVFIAWLILGSYQRNKADQEKSAMLQDPDYRKSAYRSLVEEVYQQYLTGSLTSIEKYKQELEKLKTEDNQEEIEKREGNIRFESEMVKLLKQDKAEFDKDKDKLFSRLLRLDTLEEARSEINDIFSANASTALARAVK